MNNPRFICFVLLATLVFAGGCVTRPARDPLEGWRYSGLTKLAANKAITDDYQDYIQNLSPEERRLVGWVEFFEDGTGQHAVKITINWHGTWWRHVLIYDRDNNRIKVTKYKSGSYRS